jgi:hypothetical protein
MKRDRAEEDLAETNLPDTVMIWAGTKMIESPVFVTFVTQDGLDFLMSAGTFSPASFKAFSPV